MIESFLVLLLRYSFLTTSTSLNSRRWAADGLAYLSLDADVKEELVDNLPALKALFAQCQCQDSHVLYSIITIVVNLTNSYDVQKPDKQMLELAAYAKQHIPKEHAKVTHDNYRFNCIQKRK
jgi:protein unc-45